MYGGQREALGDTRPGVMGVDDAPFFTLCSIPCQHLLYSAILLKYLVIFLHKFRNKLADLADENQLKN